MTKPKPVRFRARTGCRPAQLFGLWMIEPNQFKEIYAQAMRVDLVALAHSRQQALAARKLKADAPSGPLPSEAPDIVKKKKAYGMDGPIALFSISGPMTKYETSFQEMFGGTATLKLRQSIRDAAMDDDVLGAAIYVDSPGGTVDGTKALADDIYSFAAQKPCFVYIDGMGCSAAYWCASQATQVYASPTSLVGSIGTRIRLEDTSAEYKQAGVKVHEITTGPMKAAGADGTEIDDSQLAYFQSIADQMQSYFAAGVLQGRKMTAEQLKAVSDGSVFLADKAKQLGLVDRVCSQDDAMDDLKNRVFFGSRFPQS
jgi:signal peptide peptidase SppA